MSANLLERLGVLDHSAMTHFGASPDELPAAGDDAPPTITRRIAVLLQSDPDREFVADTVRILGYEAKQFRRPSELIDRLLAGEHFDLLMVALEGDQASVLSGVYFLRRSAIVSMPLLLLMRPEQLTNAEHFDRSAVTDFAMMPCEERELSARISGALYQRLAFGAYIFDPLDRTVNVYGRTVELQPRQFELALYMFRHAGEAQSREQIYDAVWGRKHSARSTRTLDAHVATLRSALELRWSSEASLVSIRSYGYCLRLRRT